MDLRYCPSCKQSVLDDDVADCPFCGESMSGKPGAAKKKPAGKSAAKPGDKKSAGKKSASRKAAGPKGKASAKKAGGEDPDHPFEVDQTAAIKAIQAGTKPGRGRTHKVKCPMCETLGFVPRTAIGKDIRCANEDCMVPIFKLERKKKTAADKRPVQQQVEESSSKSPMLLYGGIAAVVILTGLGALFLLRDSGGDIDNNTPFDIPKNTTKTETGNGATEKAKAKEQAAPVVEKIDYAGIRSTTVEDMVDAARKSNGNRDKPYCRRLTADAYAMTGQFDKSAAELDQLMRINKRRGYYRIQPLTRMAFQKMQTGDSAGAGQAIDQAQEAASSLPDYGRTAIDHVIVLAAAMVATGRTADADNLLEANQRDRSVEADVAEVLTSAELSLHREFGAAGLAETSSIDAQSWDDPLRTAVAGVTMLYSKSDSAVKWSLSQPDEVRADCLALCSEIAALKLVELGESAPLDQVMAAVGSGSNASLVKAVAARSLSTSAKHAEKAKAYFAEAKAGFDALPEMPPAKRPSAQQTFAYEIPAAGPVRAATILGTELCSTAAQLKDASAIDILKRTLTLPYAVAPSPTDVQKGVAFADSNNVRGLVKRLKNASTNDQIRSGVREFQAKWAKIERSAGSRRQMLASVVRNAADSGLHKELWELLPTLDAGDNIEGTDAVWHIVDGFKNAGDDAGMKSAMTMLNQKSRLSPLGTLSRQLSFQISQGQSRTALDFVKNANASAVDISRTIVRTAAEQTKDGQLETVLKFLRGLPPNYAPVREEALDLVAAKALRFKDPSEVRSLIDSMKFAPTELTGAYHGLAVGLGRALQQQEMQAGQ